MEWLLLLLIFPFLVILYSCLCINSRYDRDEEDRLQEEFLRNYKRK